MVTCYSHNILAAIPETSPCSLGCTDSLVMAAVSEHALSPKIAQAHGEPACESEVGTNLRFLSLRVPIYERLVRETTKGLEELFVDSRVSHHVSSEYQRELEFLQTGLAKALDRLAVEHGLSCHNGVAEVCSPQLREVSPEVNATV